MVKKLLAALLATFVLSACSLQPTTFSPDTKPVQEVMLDSLGRVTIAMPQGVGVCTAFAIAPHQFMTAAHCTPAGAVLRVDGYLAFPVAIDAKDDIAILLVNMDRPSVTFRHEPLHRFEHVFAAGYGYGFIAPLVTEHRSMLFNYVIGPGIAPGTVYMNGFIGGMSGGPVFDDTGMVVGNVLRGSAQIGYGLDVEAISAFLAHAGDYEPHQAAPPNDEGDGDGDN